MPAWKHVGRNPNSDASMVTKAYVDERRTALAVTPQYILDVVDNYASAISLVDQSYIDERDATRAKIADVDTADDLYLAAADRGASNGVASLDGSGTVPMSQLPTPLVTSLPMTYVEAQTVNLEAEQTVTSSVTKTYQAAVLTITDPGFPYVVLPFAMISGRCPGTIDHSRRVGGDNFGKMTILTSSDVLMGAGVADNLLRSTTYPVVPTAPLSTTPTLQGGNLTLRLWLALYSGTQYTFEPDGFRFYALVLPGG